jgi:hypothetical protein
MVTAVKTSNLTNLVYIRRWCEHVSSHKCLQEPLRLPSFKHHTPFPADYEYRLRRFGVAHYHYLRVNE